MRPKYFWGLTYNFENVFINLQPIQFYVLTHGNRVYLLLGELACFCFKQNVCGVVYHNYKAYSRGPLLCLLFIKFFKKKMLKN